MDRPDAGRVVSMLAAAFPSYPMNDDTTEIYVAALTDRVFDVGLAFVVVTDWVTGRTTFPTIAELLDECANEQGRRSRRTAAVGKGKGGPVCPNCQGTKWEQHDDPQAPGYTYVIPCHVCDAERHQDHAEGHHLVDHDYDACEWPLCQKRAKSKTRPRGRVEALAGRRGPDAPARYERDF